MLVLWIAGLLVSGIVCNTGIRLLRHAATTQEMVATGYPFTLVIGVAWTFIFRADNNCRNITGSFVEGA